MTDQAGVAAAAERQRESIEQNGFARAGLAGQHRKAAGKLDIEPFDQDDVTDRQTRQHAGNTIPSRGPTFLEGPADPGALILARLETAGLYKIIGVLVPAAVRKIVPEHGGGGLRLADDADRHIGLGEPLQRFLDMPRGLVLRHHGLEAVDGAGVVALFHVVAADVHFLAGELVARAFELGLGADGVFRGRIFADHFFKRRDRLLGTALVARDVRNLVVMRGRDQVLRIGRIGAAGMQGDVAGRRADAVVVVAGVVIGVGRHQQRFARPVGIRMLAIDLLEFLRRRLRVVLLVHQVQALIVELVRGLLDEGVVLGEKLVPQRAGAAAARAGSRAQPGWRPAATAGQAGCSPARADDLRNSSVIRCADMNLRPDACDAVPAAHP